MRKTAISTRAFLCELPTSVVGVAIGTAMGGTGCAVAASFQVSAPNGRVSLPLADVDAQMGERDALILRGTDLPKSIFLLRHEYGYIAVGTTCTHLGCSVRPGKGQLQCPCQGSSFDLTGAVIRGPAQRAPNRYPVSVDGGALTVRVARE